MNSTFTEPLVSVFVDAVRKVVIHRTSGRPVFPLQFSFFTVYSCPNTYAGSYTGVYLTKCECVQSMEVHSVATTARHRRGAAVVRVKADAVTLEEESVLTGETLPGLVVAPAVR